MNLDAIDPVLVGDRVAIRPIMGPDIVVFHAAEHTAAPLITSRLGGRTLSIERYAESLQASVLVGMSVVGTVAGDLIGYGLCYDADFVSGRARFAVMTLPEHRLSPLSMNGVELFLRYVFEHFPFRALYADVLDPNLTQFAHAEAAGLLERQGTFPEYQFWRGSYIGMSTFRVTRQTLEHYVEHRPAAESTSTPRPESFDEFAAVIRDELALAASPDAADPIEVLGLDSLAYTELALLCEELFNRPVELTPETELGALFAELATGTASTAT